MVLRLKIYCSIVAAFLKNSQINNIVLWIVISSNGTVEVCETINCLLVPIN